MFSLTQSASFAATKVAAKPTAAKQSKRSFQVQAKAINSESLSKRDFLSAAVLSFGFLSVGDANAATKRVRKSSSAAPVAAKKPAATKKVRREAGVQAEGQDRRPGAERRDVPSGEKRQKSGCPGGG